MLAAVFRPFPNVVGDLGGIDVEHARIEESHAASQRGIVFQGNRKARVLGNRDGVGFRLASRVRRRNDAVHAADSAIRGGNAQGLRRIDSGRPRHAAIVGFLPFVAELLALVQADDAGGQDGRAPLCGRHVADDRAQRRIGRAAALACALAVHAHRVDPRQRRIKRRVIADEQAESRVLQQWGVRVLAVDVNERIRRQDRRGTIAQASPGKRLRLTLVVDERDRLHLAQVGTRVFQERAERRTLAGDGRRIAAPASSAATMQRVRHRRPSDAGQIADGIGLVDRLGFGGGIGGVRSPLAARIGGFARGVGGIVCGSLHLGIGVALTGCGIAVGCRVGR